MKHILLISLSPSEVSAEMLHELRRRHPDAKISLATNHAKAIPTQGADEQLIWQSADWHHTLAWARGQQLDLAVVTYGRDQYVTCAYWKAVLLAMASGAQSKLFCEEGELSRGLFGAKGIVQGIQQMLAQVLAEVYVIGISLLLLPIFGGIAVTDFTEWLSGYIMRRGALTGRGKDNGEVRPDRYGLRREE